MPPSSTAGRLSVWGFAFARTLARGSLPLLLVCVPAAKGLFPVLLCAPYGSRTNLQLRLARLPRREPFIPLDYLPAKHTSAAFTPLQLVIVLDVGIHRSRATFAS